MNKKAEHPALVAMNHCEANEAIKAFVLLLSKKGLRNTKETTKS